MDRRKSLCGHQGGLCSHSDRQERETNRERGDVSAEHHRCPLRVLPCFPYGFLLSLTCAKLEPKTSFQIYALPDISKPIYVAEGLCYVPPLLSADYAARKGTSRESLSELMVTDLGDSTFKSPHLIVCYDG